MEKSTLQCFQYKDEFTVFIILFKNPNFRTHVFWILSFHPQQQQLMYNCTAITAVFLRVPATTDVFITFQGKASLYLVDKKPCHALSFFVTHLFPSRNIIFKLVTPKILHDHWKLLNNCSANNCPDNQQMSFSYKSI